MHVFVPLVTLDVCACITYGVSHHTRHTQTAAPVNNPLNTTTHTQTWEKKKVLHKLSIPLVLDMGQVLVDAGLPLPDAAPLGADKQPLLPGSPNSTYELAAVLIHKGTSASHGHYGACVDGDLCVVGCLGHRTCVYQCHFLYRGGTV